MPLLVHCSTSSVPTRPFNPEVMIYGAGKDHTWAVAQEYYEPLHGEPRSLEALTEARHIPMHSWGARCDALAEAPAPPAIWGCKGLCQEILQETMMAVVISPITLFLVVVSCFFRRFEANYLLSLACRLAL